MNKMLNRPLLHMMDIHSV